MKVEIWVESGRRQTRLVPDGGPFGNRSGFREVQGTFVAPRHLWSGELEVLPQKGDLVKISDDVRLCREVASVVHLVDKGLVAIDLVFDGGPK